jgi:translation initiation factor IF-2
MKVKDLASIFKVETSELVGLLSNVGIVADEETEIEKEVQKKLAKRYGIAFPFKLVKAAPAKPVKEEIITPKPIIVEEAVVIVEESKTVAVDTQKASEDKKTQQKEDKTALSDQKAAKQQEVFTVDDDTKPVDLSSDSEEAYEEYVEVSKVKRKKNIKKDKEKNIEQRTSNIPTTKPVVDESVLIYEPGMTVAQIAEAVKQPIKDVVKTLFIQMKIMASASNVLDRDVVELLALEYGFEIKDKIASDLTRFEDIEIIDTEKDLVGRPPIVTIMGHVDHGKTTLLDTIRNSKVVSGEAGGITQHIGAYQVEKNGRKITFVDTPGHAAFTEMRARGAQITDIVVLVVAADDGVMPQTREAIEHAQAAKVPIIVAVNKMDKRDVNVDRIKQELTEFHLVPEEWGGSTIFSYVSALTGKGVDELLEMILLASDLENYRANPNRLGVGTVVEAKLDKGRGPVATLLVQNGSIRVGDIIVVGNTYGKIRAMQDEKGRTVTVAEPSKPVEITGLSEVPFAGDRFMILKDEKLARETAATRAYRKFSEDKGIGKPVSLGDLFGQMDDESLKELNIIVKGDVQGSIEALKGSIEKIDIKGTKINIISARVGAINETDINLALASNAIVIGFNIRPSAAVAEFAEEKDVEIRLYDIIYKLIEDIEAATKGMLDPVFAEKILGQAEVRELYKVSKVGTIAGCYVINGTIQRNSSIRLIRNNVVAYAGKMSSLKRFKDDAKEVRTGFECGITIENFNDLKIGDIIECFTMVEVEEK